MIEGRGWKHILNVLYPAFLGVSLNHEIESSPFEMPLDSRHCSSQAQLCLDALSLDTWLDMGVTLSCKHLLSTHYALLSTSCWACQYQYWESLLNSRHSVEVIFHTMLQRTGVH